MFDFMMESGSTDAKGAKVALRRWFPWVDAAHGFDGVYQIRLLILIALGMVNGIFKDYRDVPL